MLRHTYRSSEISVRFWFIKYDGNDSRTDVNSEIDGIRIAARHLMASFNSGWVICDFVQARNHRQQSSVDGRLQRRKVSRGKITTMIINTSMHDYCATRCAEHLFPAMLSSDCTLISCCFFSRQICAVFIVSRRSLLISWRASCRDPCLLYASSPTDNLQSLNFPK
jgi:hypothetical protein